MPPELVWQASCAKLDHAPIDPPYLPRVAWAKNVPGRYFVRVDDDPPRSTRCWSNTYVLVVQEPTEQCACGTQVPKPAHRIYVPLRGKQWIWTLHNKFVSKLFILSQIVRKTWGSVYKCSKIWVTKAWGCAPQSLCWAPTFVPPCRNVSPRLPLHLASVSLRVYWFQTLQVRGGFLSLIAKWSPMLTWKRKSCQIDCSLALVAWWQERLKMMEIVLLNECWILRLMRKINAVTKTTQRLTCY